MCLRLRNQQSSQYRTEVVRFEMWTPNLLLPAGKHIQLPNVMHVKFQATSSIGVKSNYLTFQRTKTTGVEIITSQIWRRVHHRLYYVSDTHLPMSLDPVMMRSRSVTQTWCQTTKSDSIGHVQYDVYNYVCHKVCSISVLVLAGGVVLFCPAIKHDLHFLATSANCVFACFVFFYLQSPICCETFL